MTSSSRNLFKNVAMNTDVWEDRRFAKTSDSDTNWIPSQRNRWISAKNQTQSTLNSVSYKPQRSIKRLIIHCSATFPDQDVNAATINEWHKKRGWNGIGYHGVILRDGTLEEGRDIFTKGAHVRGHNNDSIGLCLIGGHGASASDHFTDHFNAHQFRTLVPIITIATSFGLSIHGHNEFAAKGCPGFDVQNFMKEYF